MKKIMPVYTILFLCGFVILMLNFFFIRFKLFTLEYYPYNILFLLFLFFSILYFNIRLKHVFEVKAFPFMSFVFFIPVFILTNVIYIPSDNWMVLTCVIFLVDCLINAVFHLILNIKNQNKEIYLKVFSFSLNVILALFVLFSQFHTFYTYHCRYEQCGFISRNHEEDFGFSSLFYYMELGSLDLFFIVFIFIKYGLTFHKEKFQIVFWFINVFLLTILCTIFFFKPITNALSPDHTINDFSYPFYFPIIVLLLSLECIYTFKRTFLTKK